MSNSNHKEEVRAHARMVPAKFSALRANKFRNNDLNLFFSTNTTMPCIADYRHKEDRLVSCIVARFWRQKRNGGSSVEKAELFIKTYIRLFVLCFSLFLLVLAGMDHRNVRCDFKIN